MAGTFSISLLNPIRFYPNEDNYNPAVYYTRHMDDTLDELQRRSYQPTGLNYHQKYTTSDNPIIQIMSDYPDITAELCDCTTDLVVDSFAVVEKATDIVDQTFKIYEFTCDFIEEGDFYLKLTYVNEDDESVILISEPLNIAEVHGGTIRFEAENSTNDFSILFSTGYKVLVRCEADIIEFKPSSDNTIYNDQIHSTTIVNSTPFRRYTLAIGGNVILSPTGGVPDYMVDIINRVMSCDQVKLDGKYYTKAEGSNWEEIRPENYPYSAQRIQINESENKFQLSLEGTIPTDEDMAYVYRRLKYIGNTSDIEINGVFNRYTAMLKVRFRNVNDPFEVTVATTTTGSSDDFSITQLIATETDTIDIDQFFGSPKVIIISGLPTDPTDVFVIYERSDAQETSGGMGGSSLPPVGSIWIYEEQNAGDFALDFDSVTGQGMPERAYYGCQVCNGNNGAADRRTKFSRAVGGISVDRFGGTNNQQLTLANIPPHKHAMFGDSYQAEPNPGNLANLEPYVRPTSANDIIGTMIGPNGFDQYRIGKSTRLQAEIGATSEVGGSAGEPDSFDNRPAFIDDIYIKRIF